MIKKIFIFVSLSFAFLGCKPTEQNCFGIYIDYSLPLKIQNAEGENLLNSKYIADSIKLYYLFPDGCAVLMDRPDNGVFSKGFRMYNDVIEISTLATFYHTHNGTDYPIVPSETDPCTIYLEWNSQDTDTVKTTFAYRRTTKEDPLPSGYCSFEVYDKVYYNGELIVSSWDDNRDKMSQGIFPVIVKE